MDAHFTLLFYQNFMRPSLNRDSILHNIKRQLEFQLHSQFLSHYTIRYLY